MAASQAAGSGPGSSRTLSISNAATKPIRRYNRLVAAFEDCVFSTTWSTF